MKKLNFRAILILLLVVVLAFALVACGDKDKNPDTGNNNGTDSGNNGGNNNGGNNNGDDTSDIANVKSYFNTLWDLTNGIGGEEIADNEDLAVSFDLGLGLETVDSVGGVYQKINVGLGIEAILDRSSKDSSANTAFKIKVYGDNNENWVTVYYFFNDPANIYLDFASQNIVVPFNYESADGSISTEKFSALFYDFMNKDFTDGTLKDKSVADIIAYFSQEFGDDWTLNTLVSSVLKLFNIDNLKEMIFPEDPDNPTNEALAKLGGYLGVVGLNKDNMFDAKGNLDLKGILTNDMIASMVFNNDNTKVTATGAHTEISLGETLGGTLGGMLEKYVPGISSIVNGDLLINLDYGITDSKIDGFDIGVKIGGITAKVNKKTVSPKITISINNLSIGKAPKSGLEMATEKTNYSSEIAVDAKVALELKGITLNLEALLDKEKATAATDDAPIEDAPTGDAPVEEVPQASYGEILKARLAELAKKYDLKELKLDGTLEIGVYGKADIANRPDKKNGKANTSALKAWIAYDDVNIVEMSFVGDRIAVVVNQKATIDEVPIVEVLINLFGDKIYELVNAHFGKEGQIFAEQLFNDDTHLVVNPKFQGAVWTDINLGKNFNDVVNMLIGMIGGSKSAEATSAAETNTLTKIVQTISKVIPYIDTKNGLTIDVTNKTVGTAVAEIGKIWDEEMGNQANFIGTIIENSNSDMLSTAIEMISLKGVQYKNATEFFTELFKSNAKITLDLGEDGILLDVDVDVNKDCGVDLSISFGAEKIDESKIVDLGAEISETGKGWYYYSFAPQEADALQEA